MYSLFYHGGQVLHLGITVPTIMTRVKTGGTHIEILISSFVFSLGSISLSSSFGAFPSTRPPAASRLPHHPSPSCLLSTCAQGTQNHFLLM